MPIRKFEEGQPSMHAAYLIITVVFALMVTFSGVAKIQRDERSLKVVHETVGVPLKYFPLLAACELAGGAGLVIGILWPILGIVAGAGLELYFLGAVASHLRAGDRKGSGSAVLMLVFASVVL